jgi:hypothetical protein
LEGEGAHYVFGGVFEKNTFDVKLRLNDAAPVKKGLHIARF